MKLVFDPVFDDGAYPGPLGDQPAVVGEKWIGPRGLLGILETALGLAGPTITQAERAAGLVPVLEATEGFWSASFANDAFATAAEVLRWRDMLRLCGWEGKGTAARLKDLESVTHDVLPGYPDRLATVAGILLDRGPDIAQITRIRPVDDLPVLWQDVFGRLVERGVTVEDIDLAPVETKGNLRHARTPDFTPDPDDDSLQLLRAGGPMEAAERVAAYLRGSGDLSGTVVVGADALLDAALHRYGLPTTGATAAVAGNAVLQVLPLVLACGWDPPDPRRVLELLMLPVGPVPRGLGNRLAAALHKWPAVGSDAWQEAMAKGLDSVEEDARRARLAQRMAIIFTPAAGATRLYPADEVASRLAMLASWLQGRKEADSDGTIAWDAAVAQCSILGRLIEYSGLTGLSAAQLKRLVEQATADAPVAPVRPAEAGLMHVREPGGVAGPAARVVWWGFSRDSVLGGSKLPLLNAEREELAAAGVALPDPGRDAVCAAERWQRPLMQTAGTLVLVCPGKDEAGEDLYPHPLWDVIAGRLANGLETAHPLIRQVLSPDELEQYEREPAPLPVAQREWSARTPIALRETESPTGAGDLVGCPLKWVLNYVCDVRGGGAAALPGESQLWGSLLHHIVAEVLKAGARSADQARADAEQLFDEEGPRMAATLFLPGTDPERVRVRRAAGLSAQQLWKLLHSSGATVVSSEQAYRGQGLGREMTGTPDLVINNPMRVIDLKWRGRSFRSDSLQAGTAYQLAAYGHLAREAGGDVLPGAYFILAEQALLTACGEAFPNARVVAGPSPSDTWRAFESAYLARCDELEGGKVGATAIVDAEGNGPPGQGIGDDGRMTLEPPCKFCDYGQICGHAFEVES